MRSTLFLFVTLAGLTSATTFNVNTTLDTNGACDAASCSLRAAILAANADASATAAKPHIINVPAGHYTLTIQGINEDAGLTGDLDILNHMNIIGAGVGVTIVDGGRQDNTDTTGIHERVFDIPLTPCPPTNCSITDMDGRNLTVGFTGLTIQGGGGNSGASGGAIRNYGSTVTVSQCALINTHINPGPTGAPVLIFENSNTISYPAHVIINDTSVTGAGQDTSGYNYGVSVGVSEGFSILPSSLEINRSTISATGVGVFVYITNGTITNSTITETAIGVRNGGGLGVSQSTLLNNSSHDIVTEFDQITSMRFFPESLNLRDSILGTGCSVAAAGSLPTTSYNLYVATAGDCPVNKTDRIVTLAQLHLAPLANNGGPTLTYRLQYGSTAIDTGTCTDTQGNLVATDQRGVPRPQDGNGNGTAICDVGAYEARTPETTVDAIAAYNNGIKHGTLVGVGTGSQITTNQATFLSYLTTADTNVHANNYPSACAVLKTAVQASDGKTAQPDLIKGSGLATFNTLLVAVRTGLGC